VGVSGLDGMGQVDVDTTTNLAMMALIRDAKILTELPFEM